MNSLLAVGSTRSCKSLLTDNVVSIETMLRVGRHGVRILPCARDFTLQNVQPPIKWVPGFFPRVKQTRCDAYHSHSSNARVMNQQNCTSTLPICLHGMDRDKCTFTCHQNIHLLGCVKYRMNT